MVHDLQPHEGGPASADAARVRLEDGPVLGLLRQHFEGVDAMYLCPEIPGKKEFAARALHAGRLPSDERVLALFDDTVFGSADEGFLLTARRLCWRNARGRPEMIEWSQVDPDRMYAMRSKLVVGPLTLELGCDEAVLQACEAAFHVLAFSARDASAAPTMGRSGVVPSNQAPDSSRPTLRPVEEPEPAASHVASSEGRASSEPGGAAACWLCHAALPSEATDCERCGARPVDWKRAP
jgi:hypothetical protein